MRAHPTRPLPPAPGAARTPGEAFSRVKQTSAVLAASDRALESRVDAPTAELAASRRARSEDLGADLLAALPDAIVLVDAEGRVSECNDAARTLLGGRLDGAVWRDVIARVFDGREIEGDAVLRGSARRVSVATSALSRRPGQVVVLRDVTEERRRQAELARHERLAAMGEMTASLAHQLRTPLACALLDVDRLASAPAPADARALARLRASLRRLERLANDMLRYARGGASPKRPLALAPLIQALRESMAPQLDARQASWSVRNDLPGAMAYGNADELLGALQNLVANALEACGRGAALTLVVEGRDGAVHLTLCDNGPGMAPEVCARAMEPFFTTRARGTGLGLAVAHAVAREHGGALTIASRPGEGCAVTLAIPVAAEETDA